jgi:TolB-like protein
LSYIKRKSQTLSLFNELKRRNVLRVGAAYVVTAWLVIQVVATILPAFGYGDEAVRLVTVAFAIGLVPVLIFTWAFEITPEGLKKESDVDRSQPIAAHGGKLLDRVIMVVLALGLGYFAFDNFVLDPRRESALEEEKIAAVEQARQAGRSEALVESYGDHSIAVLAFKDMSTDQDQEYLSDGIAEELLNLLASVSELRVISRSSAFSYKGRDIKLPEIAKELNVAHILEGSVRKAGNQVRITAQLIDARSDTHIWSETYDRELNDIFAIQDEIAGAVTEQLKVTLLGHTSSDRETDPAAYQLLLESRHIRRAGTPEGWRRSNELADRALEIQPEFARAWVVKAANYSNMAESGVLPRIESYELAREAAEKALASNPGRAGAHAAFAWVSMYYDNDLVLAARHLQRALELEPTNLNVLSSASALLLKLRRFDSAIAVQEYLSPRDPLSATGYFNLGEVYFAAGRFDDSARAFRSMLDLSPDFRGGPLWLGKALLLAGDAEGAYEAVQKESFEPFRKLGVALCAYGLGKQAEADEALEWIMQHGEAHFPYDIASVWAYRGNGERTAEWIRKAIAYNDNDLGDPVQDPLFTHVLEDSGWINLMKALGKTPEQLDSIEFDPITLTP